MRSSKIKFVRNALMMSLAIAACGAFALPGSINAQRYGSPQYTVIDFYSWYLHELNADRNPKWTSPRVNAIASTRLRQWFRSKLGREWDADYFIDAQDWQKNWEDNIEATPPVVNGNNANLQLVLGPRGDKNHWVLKIKMVKEAGTWKIDRVNGN